MKGLILLFLLPWYSVQADDFLKLVADIIENDPEYIEVSSQYDYQKSFYRSQFSELLLPDLTLSLNKIKDQSETTQNLSEYRYHQLKASFSLFHFGSDLKNYQAARHRLQSYKNEVVDNLIQREKVIIEVLLSAIATQRNIQIRKQLFELKEKVYRISKKRFQNGSLAKEDLLKLEIDVANAESEYLAAQSEILKYQNQLRALNAQQLPPDFPWKEEFKPKKITKLLAWQPQVSELPQLKRFDLASKRFQQEATALKLSHFGEVSLSFARDQYINQDDEDSYGWSSTLTYTLPLFEKFQRQTNIDLAKSKALTAKTLYSYQKREAESKVLNSKKNLELSFRNYQRRIKTLKNAKNLFTSSTKRFRTGRLSVNELLIEQDRLLKTQLLTNESIRAMHLSFMDYHHQYGKPLTKL